MRAQAVTRALVLSLGAARTPLLLLSAVIAINILAWQHIIPSPGAVLMLIRSAMSSYGVGVMIPVSLLENIVGFNVYFPGSVAILVGMAGTAGDPHAAVRVWCAIVLGSLSGQHMNYLIGHYLHRGARREAHPGTLRSDVVVMGVAFWHPHFAALASFAAGERGMAYRRFLGILTTVAVGWYAMWGCTMYLVGGILLKETNPTPWVGAVLVLWAAWRVRGAWEGGKQVGQAD